MPLFCPEKKMMILRMLDLFLLTMYFLNLQCKTIKLQKNLPTKSGKSSSKSACSSSRKTIAFTTLFKLFQFINKKTFCSKLIQAKGYFNYLPLEPKFILTTDSNLSKLLLFLIIKLESLIRNTIK